jgi:hypothetical protein
MGEIVAVVDSADDEYQIVIVECFNIMEPCAGRMKRPDAIRIEEPLVART